MALPTSIPGQLNVVLQPLPASDLNIQNPFDPSQLRPADPNAFANGYDTVKRLIVDRATLQPSIAAVNAQAEDARTKALMNVSLRPIEQDAVSQELAARAATGENTTVKTQKNTAEVRDPLHTLKVAQANLDSYGADAQVADNKLVEAQQALDDAQNRHDAMPEGIYKTEARKELDAAVKKRDSAINAQSNVAKQLKFWETKLKIITAENESAGARAGTDATLTAGAEAIAPLQVSAADANARAAAQAARNAADAATSESTINADIRTRQNQAQLALGQSQVALAPFVQQVPQIDANGNVTQQTQVGGPILQALSEGQQAAAVSQALTQRAQLAVLASQIANGSFAGTSITPEQDKSLRDEAAKNGVSVILPNGGKRPLADISKDLVRNLNYKEAEPQLKEIREASQAAQSSSAALAQVSKALQGLSTGKLYAFPGVKSVDRVLAQLGVEQSQKREVLSALNTRLLSLVRQPGAVSDFEQRSYSLALPNETISPETNATILNGLVAVRERTDQKLAFYDRLLGTLPVGEVNKVWNQYMEQNPSILDANTANPGALSPKEYVDLVTAPDKATADRINNELAAKRPVKDLRRGTTAAELAAVPASDPFVAIFSKEKKDADGNPALIAAPNPKYLAPLVELALRIRAGVVPAQPAATPLIAPGAMTAPIDSFLRSTGSPAASPFAPAELRAQ